MTNSDLSPHRRSIQWLIAALSVGALPHFVYQPFWVAAIFIAMMGWRLLHDWQGWPLPSASRKLKLIHSGGAVLIVLLILSQYGLTIGRDAGVALLTIMLAFKIVELKSTRDYYLSCFLGYFLVITNFFYSQSVFMVVLMLLVVVLLTSCLLSINTSSSILDDKSRLRLSAKMVLQALPVMLFLFVLFPRISGPIWGLPQDATTSTTGLSEQLTLGEISQLILSDEIAFRVQFKDNQHPPQDQLYWRGPVLWQTDGTTWSPLGKNVQQLSPPTVSADGQKFEYTTTLEPHNKKWLFALDFPTSLPQSLDSHLSYDGRLDSNKRIKQRTQYTLQSQTDYKLNADNDPDLNAALQLPENKHPRTLELAASLKQQTTTPAEYINKVLDLFHQQDFHYTLQPPLLQGDTIDAFLFETRRGFCEHYAASFTVLMRAADIPARIVTGYLGGDINPVDDILIVRQRDAHAWSEVWLPGQGWVRIDPTAAVANERIERGISDILPAARRSPALIARNDRMVELWQQVKYNWDAFNSAWDMWIVAYGPEKQLELLSKLGMNKPDWQKMAAVLAALLLLTGLVMLIATYRRHEPADPVVKAYQRFCRQLSRAGITRQPHEGPLDFSLRAQQQLPDFRDPIDTISRHYIGLRYGHADSTLAAEFARQVKAFHPRH